MPCFSTQTCKQVDVTPFVVEDSMNSVSPSTGLRAAASALPAHASMTSFPSTYAATCNPISGPSVTSDSSTARTLSFAALVTAFAGRVHRLAAVAVNAKPPTTWRRVMPRSDTGWLEDRSFADTVRPQKTKRVADQYYSRCSAVRCSGERGSRHFEARHLRRVVSAHAASRIAVTPIPPAVQTEIRPRPR